MKRIASSIITAALLLAGVTVKAQDCRLYFPDKVGATREMKFYDDKGKLTSVSRQEILDKTVTGKDVVIKVRSTTYDTSDQEVFGGDLEMMCEGGVFKFDMRSMIDPNTMATYKEMGMEITTDNILYPANLSAGEILPDGNLKMVVKSGQTTLMTITVTVSNRKVVATENITTEAGTFECYKLSYDSVVKMGFITISASAVEWIADGVGVVRSETFNKKGKSTGYSVLTNLTR
ncbi:MAG: hypothetical protein IH591_19395 [Bacteroidales bacterium]|nr:hypothetical protein [Bacteroidales bacterium]